jgi:AcrR family transcriptional regulator
MAPSRERLLEAGYACVARYGIGKTGIEDVAREAGLSRATVYRYFPGGKEQLIAEVVAWEAGRFFIRLAEAVVDEPDLATRLEKGLVFAHQAVEDHAVLQKILETEPELLMPHLTVESARLLGLIKAFLVVQLSDAEIASGVDPAAAADWIARMVLSYISAQGGWDLTDPDAVHDLVRRQILPGVTRVT